MEEPGDSRISLKIMGSDILMSRSARQRQVAAGGRPNTAGGTQAAIKLASCDTGGLAAALHVLHPGSSTVSTSWAPGLGGGAPPRQSTRREFGGEARMGVPIYCHGTDSTLQKLY